MSDRAQVLACAAAVLACAGAAPSWASNGLNMIGFGAESVLMAGADAAVARDSTALNTNPAGLAAGRALRLDLFSGLARALDVGHADAFGNDVSVSNRWAPIAGAGHTRPLGEGWVAGAGFFVQGGAGARYDSVRTAFGTQDEMVALTGIAKVAAGLGWQASEQLALGVSLSAVYAGSQQRQFPATSVFDPANPRRSFFGTRLEGARTLRPGWRWGLQWRLHADWVVAAVFAPQIDLPLTHGTLTVNYASAGLGAVRYHSVRLVGLALPRELSLGVAWQPSAQTLVSAKLSRLAWSRALAALTLDARDPNVAAAAPGITNTQRLVAHDRTLLAVGLRQVHGPEVALLAGVNHMRRPLADSSLSPLFAPLGENHLTLGFSFRRHDGSELTWGFEYLLPQRVRYTNPDLPFGAHTQARNQYLAVHAMWSRRW